MEVIAFIDILTIIISICLFYKGKKYFYKDARFLILGVLWVFYILPMVLDYIVMFNDYSYSGEYNGLAIPRKDLVTVLCYDVALIIIQLVILYYPAKFYNSFGCIQKNTNMQQKYYIYLLIAAAIPTIMTICLLHNTKMLFMMQWRELQLFPTGGPYSTIERFSFLGVVCSVILTFGKRTKHNRHVYLRILGILFTYFNICIQGKRAIMFFTVICILLTLIINIVTNKKLGVSNKKYFFTLFLLIPIAAIFMILMSFTVKVERGYDPNDTDKFYTTSRIDFFRDDRVRMAIYAETNDNMQILEYPLQTLPAEIGSLHGFNYILNFLGGGVAAYQTHFTYAMTQKKKPPILDVKNESWMTVTFFAECISNFGIILGTLVWILVCLLFVRLISGSLYPFNVMYLSLFVLLNLFDLTYLAIYIEFLIFLLLIKKYNIKISKYGIFNKIR